MWTTSVYPESPNGGRRSARIATSRPTAEWSLEPAHPPRVKPHCVTRQSPGVRTRSLALRLQESGRDYDLSCTPWRLMTYPKCH